MAAPDRNTPPRMTDYARARADYRVSAPPRFNPVKDILEPWAHEEPDALALLTIGEAGEERARHSASQLAALARRGAQALIGLGIGPGERIVVMLPRSVEWYAVMLGAMRIGVVPIPAPNLLTAKDITDRVVRGNAVALVTDAAGARKAASLSAPTPGLRHRICAGWAHPPADWLDWDALVAAAPDPPLPDDPTSAHDPLLVYFTSGTVGPPKMVEHDQSYALGHVATARFWHDLREGDRHWTVSDTGWAKAAWGGLFGQWHERAAVVQVALGKPDADMIAGVIARHGVTSFCAPPTLYRQLIQADFAAHDLSALRHCTSAGEPLNPEVIREWGRLTGGLEIHDGFGQTESTVLVANFRCEPIRAGSMGKPVPGYDVTVLDDDGGPVPPGVAGHVAVACDPHPVGLFHGYDDAEATGQRFRGGFYYTGDRAARDADGYFWFEGREDDVITSSAYRIGPFEVESALIEHRAVIEAGVVGRPDPQRTEIVCAFVRLAPGFTPTEDLTTALQTHVRNVTAPYKYPREILYVSELPKTISGKIRRAVLREWLSAGVPPDVWLETPRTKAPISATTAR